MMETDQLETLNQHPPCPLSFTEQIYTTLVRCYFTTGIEYNPHENVSSKTSNKITSCSLSQRGSKCREVRTGIELDVLLKSTLVSVSYNNNLPIINRM